MNIIPLTKSPLPHKGRWGTIEKQDWYRGLVLASQLASTNPEAKVAVISAVHVMGAPSEADNYFETLQKLGVPKERIVVIREAQETIGQIEIATKLEGEKVFVVAPTHYLRVLWLLLGCKNCKVIVGWGRPRPAEAITDMVIAFVFPFIDMFRGGGKWFQRLVTNRRKKGNQF